VRNVDNSAQSGALSPCFKGESCPEESPLSVLKVDKTSRNEQF